MTVREAYAKWCGPVALASAKGVSPEDMAVYLIAFGHLMQDGGTVFGAIGPILGVKTQRQPNIYKYHRGLNRKPTVRRWLDDHPTGSYVLYVPGHVLHVRDGEVVADSAGDSSRRRVTHYWGPLP